MSRKRRYVIDNNVIVSGLLFADSVPGRVVDAAVSRGELLISSATFAELCIVLRRPKFDRYECSREARAVLGTTVIEGDVVCHG